MSINTKKFIPMELQDFLKQFHLIKGGSAPFYGKNGEAYVDHGDDHLSKIMHLMAKHCNCEDKLNQMLHEKPDSIYEKRKFEEINEVLFGDKCYLANRVWSIVRSDNDAEYIVPGNALSNKDGYILTEESHQGLSISHIFDVDQFPEMFNSWRDVFKLDNSFEDEEDEDSLNLFLAMEIILDTLNASELLNTSKFKDEFSYIDADDGSLVLFCKQYGSNSIFQKAVIKFLDEKIDKRLLARKLQASNQQQEASDLPQSKM